MKMDYNNFGKGQRNFKPSMQFMPRYYGTSAHSAPNNTPIFFNTENIIGDKMTADPMMNGLNNVFGSAPIISNKTFKSYPNSNNLPGNTGKRDSNPLKCTLQPTAMIRTVLPDVYTAPQEIPECSSQSQGMFHPITTMSSILHGLFNNLIAAFPKSKSSTVTLCTEGNPSRAENKQNQANSVVSADTICSVRESMSRMDLKDNTVDCVDKKVAFVLEGCQSSPGHSNNIQINRESVKNCSDLNVHGAVVDVEAENDHLKCSDNCPVTSDLLSDEVIQKNDVKEDEASVVTSDKKVLNSSVEEIDLDPSCILKSLNQDKLCFTVPEANTADSSYDEVDFNPSCGVSGQSNPWFPKTVTNITDSTVTEIDFSLPCDLKVSDTCEMLTHNRWQRSNPPITESKCNFVNINSVPSCQNDITMETKNKPKPSRFLQAVRQRAAETTTAKTDKDVPKVDSVSQCEDKLAKLKEMLSKRSPKSITLPSSNIESLYKIPNADGSNNVMNSEILSENQCDNAITGGENATDRIQDTFVNISDGIQTTCENNLNGIQATLENNSNVIQNTFVTNSDIQATSENNSDSVQTTFENNSDCIQATFESNCAIQITFENNTETIQDNCENNPTEDVRSENTSTDIVKQLESMFNNLSLNDTNVISSPTEIADSTMLTKDLITADDSVNDDADIHNKTCADDSIISQTVSAAEMTCDESKICISKLDENSDSGAKVSEKVDVSTEINVDISVIEDSKIDDQSISKTEINIVSDVLLSNVAEETKPVKVAISNCEDKMAKLKAMMSKKKGTTSKTHTALPDVDRLEAPQHILNELPKFQPHNSSPEKESKSDAIKIDVIEENKNHPVKEEIKKPRRTKRSKLQKNHRLSSVKLNENNAYLEDCDCASQKEGGNLERLSPSKQQDKVCNKHHKNEHCGSKHRHKNRENFKKIIQDDLAFDLDIENSPVYFTPDSLQLHKKSRNRKSKKLKKAIKKQKCQELVKKDLNPVNCMLTDSFEKCVNFLSSLPAQLSPKCSFVCRDPVPPRVSSSESEECHGFDEVKGRFLKSANSEGESDDSFIIVFSDVKKEQEQQLKHEDQIKSPEKIMKRGSSSRVRLPSECDSEDSFVICFEKDGNDSADDCYGNDEVYSDSDSVTSESDDNSNSSDEESTTESSGYVEDCDNVIRSNDDLSVDGVEKVDDDSCDGVVQCKVLKSCLSVKRKSERYSPKPAGQQKLEKKVRFDSGAPKVHKIVAWAHAYRQARIGPWERCARDAERFRQRIRDTSVCLEWVFRREHRSRIFFQRFRPLLMRALREEREAKAKEAKRLKEEEEQRIKDEAAEQERIKEENDSMEQLKAQEKEFESDVEMSDASDTTTLNEEVLKVDLGLLKQPIKEVERICTNGNALKQPAQKKKLKKVIQTKKKDEAVVRMEGEIKMNVESLQTECG